MNTLLELIVSFLIFGSIIGISYLIAAFIIKVGDYAIFQDCTEPYIVNNLYRSNFKTFKERYENDKTQRTGYTRINDYVAIINNDRYIFKTFKDYCKYLKWLEKETYKENNKKQIEAESKIIEL